MNKNTNLKNIIKKLEEKIEKNNELQLSKDRLINDLKEKIKSMEKNKIEISKIVVYDKNNVVEPVIVIDKSEKNENEKNDENKNISNDSDDMKENNLNKDEVERI